MLFDSPIMRNDILADKVVNDAKEVFGESVPYVIDTLLGGRKIVFSEHFVEVLITALSFDCMSKANVADTQLINSYISYANGAGYRDITNDESDVMKAIDTLLYTLATTNEGTIKINECWFDLGLPSKDYYNGVR